ncbi:MAG: hypothetical protein AAF934_04955 [Bacteroidota bacterium]
MDNILRFIVEFIGEIVNHVSFNTKTKKGRTTFSVLLIMLLIALIALISVIF